MTVFANALEVSCKAQSNKVVAAFPDVCMTPPENPATPPGVPVPYPNFSFDSDTDKGTGTVKIGDTTVNQKNVSYFTKSSGDEAGCAAKKGVVSSKNTGKAYSQAFSMNVKAEGKNVTRFSDIQTDNHGSPPNVPPWPKIAMPNGPGAVDPCKGDKEKEEEACGDKSKEEVCEAVGLDKNVDKKIDELVEETKKRKADSSSTESAAKRARSEDWHGSGRGSDYFYGSDFSSQPTWIGSTSGAPDGEARDKKMFMDQWDAAQLNECMAARRCKLEPFNGGDSCCPGQTGHHLVDAACFNASGRGAPGEPQVADIADGKFYDPDKAPVICAEGNSSTKGSHGALHTEMKAKITAKSGTGSKPKKDAWTKIPMKTQTPDGNGGFTVTTSTTEKTRSMTYGEFRDNAVEAVGVVFPMSDCSPECLKAQLDAYHKDLGVKDETPVRTALTGREDDQRAAALAYNRSRKKIMDQMLAQKKLAKAFGGKSPGSGMTH